MAAVAGSPYNYWKAVNYPMKKQSLCGAWRMREVANGRWHDAQVPGSVYADLLRDGSMPDPFWRENEREAFELMRHDYEYHLTFRVDDALLSCRHVALCCDGLDTLASVTLNGQPVAHVDNMHISWRWEVKPLLREGENELLIRFESPVEAALAAYEQKPGWCSTDAIPGYQHLRKTACMYGWDWGPRLPDAGIWRDIRLEGVDEGRLISVLTTQRHEDGQVTLCLKPEIDGSDTCTWHAEVVAPDGSALALPETSAPEAELCIPNPQLWWPNGYGEQPLYTVRVTLLCGGAEQDTWERRVGLRTLSVCREKDEWGESFCHIVNGVKVFALGGNYIPEDNLFSRVTPERTRRLLEDAKLAHFNLIRVWGGGYYPDDFFFDICDELGLMVWQDLLYACAFYNMPPAFEQSVRVETEQNTRRIRHHASLALICGNNEIESFMALALLTEARGNMEAFGPKTHEHYADYIKLYEYVLPSVVCATAPQTFWWPSSPSSGGNWDEPNSENRGDAHYWDVWHGEKPFTEYRKHFFRYTSEFGFQSFPSLPTVESFTLPEDRNIFSRIMERHQRNAAANGKILAYLSQTYRYPDGFDNLLYCSQLLQADAIRYGVEHWRRNRGRCMGAVIWQLNDCWPVASWSSIDYFGRWKALHYAAKRFFAPVLLSAEEEGEVTQNPKINEFHPAPIECSIRLNVSNETLSEVRGVVRWALRLPDGSAVEAGEEALTVPALSAAWLEKRVFPQAQVTRHYADYAFVVDGEVVSEGITLFCAPKHFEFADPQLTVRVEGDELVVTSAAFAKSVCVESEDADLLLSDNFFDMGVGEKRLRVLRGTAAQPRVRSVYQMG